MYYLFTANSARNPDSQNGAEMNYFHGLGKAGFGMARPASGAYAREFLGLEGRRTQFELGRGEDRIMDHGCAAWSGPRARDVLRPWHRDRRIQLAWSGPRARDVFGWKDEETWSYRSSRPESVPTCQPHWSTPRRTENGGRETH